MSDWVNEWQLLISHITCILCWYMYPNMLTLVFLYSHLPIKDTSNTH